MTSPAEDRLPTAPDAQPPGGQVPVCERLPKGHDALPGSGADPAEGITRLAALYAMDDGAVFANVGGIIVEANQSFTRLTGRPKADIIGQGIWTLGMWDDADEVRRVLEGFRTRSAVEAWTIQKQIGDLQAIVKLQPIYRLSQYQGVLLSLVNVTELVEARRRAEEASRTKDQFLANVSHEIRTPMNGVIGMIDLTMGSELTAAQRDYLETARSAAKALMRIINDILDFSKMQAGKLEVLSTEFHLRDCVGETLHLMEGRAAPKGIRLVGRIAPDAPERLLGDPGRLRQVLVNLIDNAIKFSSRGEVRVAAAVEALSDSEVRLHFTVSDQGIGIAPDKRQRIFEAFEQADGSTTRKYGGTGLGLAISRQLVERMGGTIWVESEAALGSTFHFTVCLGRAERESAPSGLPARADLRGLEVLVVSACEAELRAMCEMARSCGMSPLPVPEAAAIALLKETAAGARPIRLILADACLGEIDGFALARRIQAEADLQDTRVILVSSAGQRGDAERCLAAGVAGYLSRPVTECEVREAAQAVLSSPRQPPPRLITRHALRERRRALRILLAEDEASDREAVRGILETWGHSVTAVSDGQEAVQAVARQAFDVVLMDAQLPGMGGQEAAAAIGRAWGRSESGRRRRVPIIAMTCQGGEGGDRCAEAGVDGHLTKPIAPELLEAELERAIRGHDGAAVDHPGPPLPTPQQRAEDWQVLNPGSPGVDIRHMLERVAGDRQLLRELAGIYLDNCPRWVRQINDALGRRDCQTLGVLAHTLKGAVGNFGAEAAIEACERLERAARGAQLQQIVEASVSLEAELARLTDVLKSAAQEMEACKS